MTSEPLEAGPETFRILEGRLISILAEKLDVHLKHDTESVRYLDGYIERNRGVIHQPEGIVNLIGSFLGECMIANYGGRWVEHPEAGWGVQFDTGFTAFPFNKVGKRFRPDGQADSIVSFYTVIPVLLEQERAKKGKSEP